MGNRTKSGASATRGQARLSVRARADNSSSNSHGSRGFGNRGGGGGGGGEGGERGVGLAGGILLLAASLRGAASGAIVSAAAASCLLLEEPWVGFSSFDAMVSKLAASAAAAVSLSVGVPAAYADDDVDGRAEAAFTASAAASTSTSSSDVSGADESPSSSSSSVSDLQILDEVWKAVDDNFLPARSDSGFDRAAWGQVRERYLADPPASRARAYAAARDILGTLGDPFSRFVEPADFAPLLKYDISGVGLNIAEDAEDPTRLRVLGLVLDSPAARAGLKQGDELVAVDGESVRSRSAFQAVSLIQAAPGPDVRVTVRQSSAAEGGGERDDASGGGSPSASSSSLSGERVVTLRRSSSASNPVSARMESGSVGYIRLREFNALAEPNVARAVQSLRAEGARSFVLDLRDNPGGLVQAGVEIARLFLPPETVVAYTEGRVVAGGVKGDTDYAATTNAVALADGGSAGGVGGGGFGGLLGGAGGGGSRGSKATKVRRRGGEGGKKAGCERWGFLNKRVAAPCRPRMTVFGRRSGARNFRIKPESHGLFVCRVMCHVVAPRPLPGGV